MAMAASMPMMSLSSIHAAEANSWGEENGAKVYYGADGQKVTGAYKIGNTYYGFKADGSLDTKGFKTYGTDHYYVNKDGSLATGFQAIGNYAYYFAKDGKRAYNTTVKYLKIGKSGRLGKAYAQALRVIKKGWTLKKAFNYSAKLKFANKNLRRKTPEAYATIGFSKKAGNCFVMAATFYIQAKLLGYDVHQVSGYVGISKAPHSWCYIVQNGKKWLYDPDVTNEFKRPAYHFKEGAKGTLKYVKSGRKLLG
jgi:hypothetical protein